MDFEEYLNLQSWTFVQYYRCLPLSLLKKENADEDGNRIIMPSSAIGRLTHLETPCPYLFQIKNPSTGRVTHCGVLEFIADEGFIHMPSCLMAHLGVVENEIVLVRSTSLPTATFIKLQAHSKDFLDVSHPRELLELNFKNLFPCVTAGETIAVTDPKSERRYYLDVLEAQPADAVCSLETDCAVDFVPPLDYVEPPPHVASHGSSSDEPPQPARFTGVAARMDGKPVEQPPTPSPAAVTAVAPVVPKRKVRFGAPSAAGGGVSKGKKEGGGKEQEKRFTGTQYSLNS